MNRDKVGRVTSTSVEKHTGKSWDSWIALLEKKGARLLTHKEIVHLLKAKYRLTPWWQQIVASGFEQATGLRIEGQNRKGLYSVTSTRSCSMSASKAWALLTSDEAVDVWLKPLSPVELKAGAVFENEGVDGGGAFGEIRVVTSGRQIRFRWQETDWEKPSTCVLLVVRREGQKCLIIFTHDDLPNARVKEEFRRYWKDVLDRLLELEQAPKKKRS